MANKKKWIIKQRITCRSQFVIYIVQCPCSLRYVGSTTCELKKRILEHVRATVNTDRTNAIAKHMKKLHEGNWKSLTFFAVEQVEQQSWGGDREKILRQKEFRHILNFQTLNPKGLNQDEELHYHL